MEATQHNLYWMDSVKLTLRASRQGFQSFTTVIGGAVAPASPPLVPPVRTGVSDRPRD
jgi:hypothetical protein